MRMQEHARKAKLTKLRLAFVSTILIVADNRKPTRGQMHPNLVRAAGAQLCVNQAKSFKTLQPRYDGVGNLPFGLDFDPAFAGLGSPFSERQPDMLTRIDPIALDQG